VEISGIWLVAALVGFATLTGLLFRSFQGKGRTVDSAEQIDLARLGAQKNGFPVEQLGKKATLLQFSTEYCGQCPGLRRALSQLEYRIGGVLHAEVDITERLDLAAHFKVSQTPTVFILDPEGKIRFRVSGVPMPGIIQQELAKLGAK
jgi:thiol-disulfide isomerase/thioredoxin